MSNARNIAALSTVEVGATADQTKSDIDALGLDAAQLDAIAASKSVTAVDVFVYDTSKDSDGGAWRKRTQGTSWYNEALNTATRGSRKEFPAVAVLVLEANTLTIYDGDDPAMPMWMVFNGGSAAYFKPSSGANSVSALNGNFFIAVNAGFTGSGWFNFITDSSIASILQASNVYRVTLPMSGRNNTDVAYRVLVSNSPYTLVNANVNDIAMIVLPNAPIDSATGLPIPTIAVATDGGVSVINDNGIVYDTTVGFTPVGGITFDGEGNLFNRRNAGSDYLAFSTVADYRSGDGFGDLIASMIVGNQEFDLLGGYSDLIMHEGSQFVEAGISGLGVHTLDTTDFARTISSKITSDYNTGYMVGDIKLAALSDTDDTDVVGSELTVQTFPLTVTASIFDVVSGFSEGDVITVTKTVDADAYIYIYNNTSGSSSGLIIAVNPNDTTATFTVGSANGFTIRYYNNIASVVFNSVSVRVADTDRSVNANGLAVNGTITKTPVATGADLVGYSGFSASNYLEQPYNSDLDFGTGDFSISCWIKSSVEGRVPIARTTASGSGWGTGAKIIIKHGTGGKVDFLTSSAASVSTNYITTATPLTTGSWHFITVCRKSSGVGEIYVDGKLIEAISGTVRDVDDTSNKLLVGSYWYDTRYGYSGSVALFRISATAPSAQQIKDIYEAEKPLFQENAQATLYGTSDAVKALAHDDTTNLLHVGTSSGRSVFQGLRRVDNTTTAVGAAISASNGLVVED